MKLLFHSSQGTFTAVGPKQVLKTISQSKIYLRVDHLVTNAGGIEKYLVDWVP